MIRSSSEHALLSWVYKTYKSFLAVETDDILMAKENRIWFEIIAQEFDTLFDYTFQESQKLKLVTIDIIQSKYCINIDQIDHIMKNIIQEYWGTETKDEVKFQKSPFPTDTFFEKNSSWIQLSLEHNWKDWENTWSIPKPLGWWTHAHQCPKLLWSSIPHNTTQWLYECTDRTWLSCSKIWHIISHAPSTWTHHVLKKEN